MAAIITAVLTTVSKGDRVVASRDLYGGTLTFPKKYYQNSALK